MILFLAEKKKDIEIIKDFVLSFKISNYIILSVSSEEPHYFDFIDLPEVKSWKNKDYVSMGVYSWMLNFVDIRNFIEKYLRHYRTESFYEALLDKFAFRYEYMYNRPVSMLVRTFDDYNIDLVYAKKTDCVYLKYIEEAKLLRNLEIDYYE